MRSLVFLVVAVAYAGVWLAVAMLFSVLFRSPATAALLSLGVWLFMTLLWPMISPFLAQMIAPPDMRYVMLGMLDPRDGCSGRTALSRISPYLLFEEAVQAILSPTTPSLGPILDQIRQLRGEVVGRGAAARRKACRSPGRRSSALIAGAIMLFVATYVVFQRQEVRA